MESTSPTPQTMPSVDEMQQALRQSGVLEQQTDYSNFASGSISAGVNTAAGLNQIQLADANKEQSILKPDIDISRFRRYIPKIVAFFLVLQGLFGIYKSIVFILVEFPQLEIALEQQMITTQQINGFASRAVITIITTIISMFFAMRLAFLQSKAARYLNTMIGVAIFLGNAALAQYFNSQNSGILISTYSATFLETITHQLNQIFN